MTRWSELDRRTRLATVCFVVIILLLIILAWYGYFTGAWESYPSSSGE